MKTRFARSTKSVLVAAGFLWVFSAGGVRGATTYHVATDGSDANDGLSWATAKQTVAAAVGVAVDGDTVLVGDGTHVVATTWLAIDKGISLIGFNGPSAAVLKAGYAVSNERGVLDVNHADALVAGFTIRDGNYKYVDVGAGVNLHAGTVSNCTITACLGVSRGAVRLWGGLMTHCQVVDNGIVAGGADRKGGGAYLTGGTIQFCDFIGNQGPRGGGVCMENAAAVVRDCRFFANSNNGAGDGGGMFLNAGLVDRCVFATNNAVNYGGGLEVQGGLVRNTLVFGNTAKREGGGIRIANANARLANVTIANNRSLESPNGHGLYMTAGIASNLVVHVNGIAPFRYEAGNVYKTGGTLVQSCATPLQAGTGNMAADPLFVSPATGDYRLLPGSPCRDAADSAPGVTVDLEGNPRPVDGGGDAVARYDLGCYEAAAASTGPLRCGFSVSPAEGEGSVTAVMSAYAAGADTNLTWYAWNFGDGSPVQSGPGLDAVNHTFGLGVYTVSLTVSNASEGASCVREEAVRVGASIAYVSGAGSSTWPYDTPAKAAAKIQQAVNAVWGTEASPATIYLAEEAHFVGPADRIVVNRPVRILGGDDPLSVLIDAEGVSGRRCMLVNHPQAVVAGVTFKNGNYPVFASGECAGVRLETGLVSNCVVTANTAKYAGGATVTGGLMTDCVITNNVSTDSGTYGRGGGVYITGGTVRRCLIGANKANLGGGVYMTGGTLRECRVLGNTGGAYSTVATMHGGGVYQDGGSLINVLVAKNTIMAGGGGGVYLKNASSSLLNVTVCENTAVNAATSDGVFQENGVLRNVIAQFNGEIDLIKTGGTITYSSVGVEPAPSGDGNIVAEPLMPRRALGDYRLGPGSPGIDAGSNVGWTAQDVDLDGLPRLKFAACDMGAYEFQGAHATVLVVY